MSDTHPSEPNSNKGNEIIKELEELARNGSKREDRELKEELKKDAEQRRQKYKLPDDLIIG